MIYWDSCIFLAWLKDEDGAPSDKEGQAFIARLLDEGRLRLVTSTIARVEVLASTLTPRKEKLFVSFLRSEKVILRAPDLPVVALASKIRDHYYKENRDKEKGSRRTVCTPDAIHLATAIASGVPLFHTFDRKNTRDCLGLLGLDGEVAGHPLRIRRPRASDIEELLELRKSDTPGQTNLFDLVDNGEGDDEGNSAINGGELSAAENSTTEEAASESGDSEGAANEGESEGAANEGESEGAANEGDSEEAANGASEGAGAANRGDSEKSGDSRPGGEVDGEVHDLTASRNTPS